MFIKIRDEFGDVGKEKSESEDEMEVDEPAQKKTRQ